MQKLLLALGVILVAAGLLWPYLSRLGLGRLPGDIVWRGKHTTFYFPIVTSLILSAAISLVLWLIGRR